MFARAHAIVAIYFRAVNPAARLQQLVEQIEHADEVGLDAFGVGEHHRREFLDSAPRSFLGAAATRTQRIRLTSAVTVLRPADPVRVFREFAMLDLLSRGRAEMIVGRGSSIEAFPLFGFRLGRVSIHDPCRIRCRSGSGSVGRRNRSRAPARWDFR